MDFHTAELLDRTFPAGQCLPEDALGEPSRPDSVSGFPFSALGPVDEQFQSSAHCHLERPWDVSRQELSERGILFEGLHKIIELGIEKPAP